MASHAFRYPINGGFKTVQEAVYYTMLVHLQFLEPLITLAIYQQMVYEIKLKNKPYQSLVGVARKLSEKLAYTYRMFQFSDRLDSAGAILRSIATLHSIIFHYLQALWKCRNHSIPQRKLLSGTLRPVPAEGPV